MHNHDQDTYLGERIAFEDRVAALARSAAARRIHTELRCTIAANWRCCGQCLPIEDVPMAKYIVAMILALSPAIASAQSAAGTTGGAPAATSPPASTSAAGLYGPPAPTVEAHTRMPAATAMPAASDGTQTPQKHRGRRRGSYAGTDAGIGG